MAKWTQKFDESREKRALSFDFDDFTYSTPLVLKALGRVVFSDLESKCADHSYTLMSEKTTFVDLSRELAAKERLVINIKELLRQSPTLASESMCPSTHETADL